MTSHAASSTCTIKPTIAVKPRTVSINGVPITRAAIAQEIQNHPASKPTDAWLAAARALAVRELLLQEARRLGVVPVPIEDDKGRRETNEEAAVRTLIEVEVKTPEADEAVCQRYYETNAQRFRSSDLFEVRHILLPAAPADESARMKHRQRATALLAELKLDLSAFDSLAATISACPSGKVGGSLGQIGAGQTVPEFESALARISEGEVAVVETRYGIHIVALDRSICGRALPFELVRERIAAWLNEKVRRQAIKQYISILAGKADVVGIELASTATPLVQ